MRLASPRLPAEESTLADMNPFAPNPDLRIWIDGALVPTSEAKISVFDHGLLYGDGCFEGLRVYDGKVFKLEAHVRRLLESCKALRLDLGRSPTDIRQAVTETVVANGITGDGYVRLVATRGVGSLGISVKETACPSVIVIADALQLYPQELYETGLRGATSSMVRNHPNSLSPRIKSLNYLNNILAKLEARDSGADEALMLNHEGRVAECSGDNLFIVRDGAICTPPASEGILDGITRGYVMELARANGYRVVEKALTRHDIYVADECFLTGTAAEVIAMVSLDNRPIGDGTPGPVTRELKELFRASVREDG
jgi:branched-chain amino acid aminotransferase